MNQLFEVTDYEESVQTLNVIILLPNIGERVMKIVKREYNSWLDRTYRLEVQTKTGPIYVKPTHYWHQSDRKTIINDIYDYLTTKGDKGLWIAVQIDVKEACRDYEN